MVTDCATYIAGCHKGGTMCDGVIYSALALLCPLVCIVLHVPYLTNVPEGFTCSMKDKTKQTMQSIPCTNADVPFSGSVLQSYVRKYVHTFSIVIGSW